MKPRKVVITIEMKTSVNLQDLRSKDVWEDIIINSLNENIEIHQVSAQVVKEDK